MVNPLKVGIIVFMIQKIIHFTPMEFYSNYDIWLVTAQIVIERRTTGRQMRMIYTEEVFEIGR